MKYVLFLVLTLVIPPGRYAFGQGQAEHLAVGTWTGEIIGPDGVPKGVAYTVAIEGDSLKIGLELTNAGFFPFENITLKDGTLAFTFEAEVLLACKLKAQSKGSYHGKCAGPDGISGTMFMAPPQMRDSN